MYVVSFPLLVIVLTVHPAEHDCYDSVLLHRSDSILPSTNLFCIIHSNQEALIDVPIIQTDEQWSTFAIENPIVQEKRFQRGTSLPVLLKRKGSEVSEFLLPFSLFDGKCTGTQPVVLGISQSVVCSPSFNAFTEGECQTSEFLSAQSLFGLPVISTSGNTTAETDFRWNSGLLSTHWRQNRCENVINKISADITLNGTLIVDAQLNSIDYITVTDENYTNLIQEFHIAFKSPIVDLVMNEEVGYERGYTIYVTKDGETTSFLSVPQSGPCQSDRQHPVRFLVNSTTACTLRYSHCTELKQEIEQLMEEFVPTWIRSSPVEETNATDAMVIVRNRTHLERATTANCLVVTSVSITLYYAKQGTQANHRLLIVSAIYDMNLEAVHVVPNSTIALRFSTQFKDVTPSPILRFVSLPYIELRLPNDFFYPFMEKSAVAYVDIVIVTLMYIFIYSSDVL